MMDIDFKSVIKKNTFTFDIQLEWHGVFGIETPVGDEDEVGFYRYLRTWRPTGSQHAVISITTQAFGTVSQIELRPRGAPATKSTSIDYDKNVSSRRR